jgi:hypothetical protein
MHGERDGKFERTDIWREGTWLDLWSVVHFLSGISIGLGFYFLHFGALASVVIALLALIAYEMWEVIVQIQETPTNRFMDVVVGMISFLPTFFLLAPRLSPTSLILAFMLVLSANIIMSIFGWYASHKAAALEQRMRERYVTERMRLVKQRKKLQERFQRDLQKGK